MPLLILTNETFLISLLSLFRFNFFENTAPDLENISYADKFAYGTAQETTIGRNIFSAIQAGVESGVSDKTFQQALKDM